MSYLLDLLRAAWRRRPRLTANRGKAISPGPKVLRSDLFPWRFKGIEHPDVLVMIVECLQPGLSPDVAERLDRIIKLVPDSKNRQLEIWTKFMVPLLAGIGQDHTLPVGIRLAINNVVDVYSAKDSRSEWRILQMRLWLMFSQVIISRRARGLGALNKPLAALSLAYFCAVAGTYLHQTETPEISFSGLTTMKDAVRCLVWVAAAIDTTWDDEDAKALAKSGNEPTPFVAMSRWTLFRQEFFSSYAPASASHWDLDRATAMYNLLARRICYVCGVDDVT